MEETDDVDLCEEADANHPTAGSISAIDKKSVHRICSGQVVLTLATAVKELLENSIDAGATIIDIKLKDYGGEQIEVIDNGRGVHHSNFQGLTLKHHTSKLQDFSDLINVDTFGFRGEALSSLCALSMMSITTRHTDAAVGTRLEYDHNGTITSQSNQARQVGTTVTLQNLFYTLPVRHKEFQRNTKKEFVKMVQILSSYCIISTGVRITCTNQTGKGSRSTVVSSKGNTTMLENIANVFGPKQMQSLLEFKKIEPSDDQCSEFGIKKNESSLFRIEGHVSKCEHGQGRSSTDRQFFFINGRPFDSSKLSKLVNEVYHQYNRHQYPFVVFNMAIQKDNVDVNVTPDKRQVFMEGERLIMATVNASLVDMYEPTTSVLQYQLSTTQACGTGPVPLGGSDFTRLTRHHSLEKPSDVPSLMKLKRSFSSAFSKGTTLDNTCSNRSPAISQMKQRRLDTFVASCGSPSNQRDVHAFSEGNKDEPDLDQDVVILEDLNHVAEENSGHRVIGECDICVDKESIHKEVVSIKKDGVYIVKDHVQQDDDVSGKKDMVYEKSCNKSGEMSGASDNLTQWPDETGDNLNTPDEINYQIRYSEDVSKYLGEIKMSMLEVNENECVQSNTRSVQKGMLGRNNSEIRLESHRPDNQSLSIIQHEASDDIDDGVEKVDCVTEEDHVDTVEELDTEEQLNRKEKCITFSVDCLKNRWRSEKSKVDGNKFSRTFRATISPTENQVAEQELQREIKKDMFGQMEILGQFNLGFIIAKLEKDLFIVDQHASDEKYNFETLQRDTVIQSQKLISPLNLDLTSSSETILMDNIDIFTKNGFEFVIDEEGPPTQRVKLMSTPVSKNWNFGKEDIEEMLFMLTDSPGVICRPSRVRAMFASRACRKSIMIGTTLKRAEMKKLVCHMGELEQPWNCPHGRPTMRHLINLDMVPR